MKWRKLTDGYEAYGDHYYFRVIKGAKLWRVGYRIGTHNPLKVIGVYTTLEECKARAEQHGACL
jgi:hypothetical protein